MSGNGRRAPGNSACFALGAYRVDSCDQGRAGIKAVSSVCRAKCQRGVLCAPGAHTGKGRDQPGDRQSAREGSHPDCAAYRCIMPFPKRSKHDLVGIDNRRAGYLITEHLLKLGCRRIVFVAYSNGASTVEARIAGFREALFSYGVPLEADSVQRLASITEAELKRVLDTIGRASGRDRVGSSV